jgi:hypothetical protein
MIHTERIVPLFEHRKSSVGYNRWPMKFQCCLTNSKVPVKSALCAALSPRHTENLTPRPCKPQAALCDATRPTNLQFYLCFLFFMRASCSFCVCISPTLYDNQSLDQIVDCGGALERRLPEAILPRPSYLTAIDWVSARSGACQVPRLTALCTPRLDLSHPSLALSLIARLYVFVSPARFLGRWHAESTPLVVATVAVGGGIHGLEASVFGRCAFIEGKKDPVN